MINTTKPALPEPVAYLHDVVAADGEPDQALSFSPDNFPLAGVGGFRSVACTALYTQAAIDAAVADYAQALSSALGWPGGISDPVLDWPTLLRSAAEARAVPEWQCACDEQGRGEPGVTCGDCPRDYGHCATPSPTSVEQPKPVARVREALDTVMALQWSGNRAHMDALHRLCQACAALSEQPAHPAPVERVALNERDTAVSCDYVYTADQLRTAIEAAVAEARTEIEELKSDIADALTTIALYEAEARAVPGEGWTDADADAARLALELECLLTDKDVPMPALSRWWDSAHEALRLHRERLAATPSPAEQTKPGVRDDDARDAARYRWLRHGDNDEALLRSYSTGEVVGSAKVYLLRNAELDAAIDAALSGEQP